MFVRACPRPMHNVLCAGTIEARALWIRTRESGISLRRWRRLCHGGPPVVRNGPKDTDLTPVAPRYCSPGLPDYGRLPISCRMRPRYLRALRAVISMFDALEKGQVELPDNE